MNKRGFSLVELIIVIAILGIIAVIAVPSFVSIQQRSAIKADILTGTEIGRAMQMMQVTEEQKLDINGQVKYSDIVGSQAYISDAYTPVSMPGGYYVVTVAKVDNKKIIMVGITKDSQSIGPDDIYDGGDKPGWVWVSESDGTVEDFITANGGNIEIENVQITEDNAGLYRTGTNEQIKSWTQLIEEGIITAQGKVVNGKQSEIKGDIVIPSGITELQAGAFEACANLTGVKMSDDLLIVGNGAFYGCTNLSNVKLSTNLNKIGNSAFGKCTSLSTLKIPDNVTSIVSYAFVESGLERIHLPDSVTAIGQGVFYDCEQLKEVRLPSTLTMIYPSTFDGCINLEQVNIPDTLVVIGPAAFYNCQKLKNVVLPDGLTAIYGGAFTRCHSMTSFTIPASVTNIYPYQPSGITSPITDCNNLVEIIVEEGNANYYVEGNCIVERATMTLIGGGDTSTGILTIPDGVTTIPFQALYGCRTTKKVIIPNSVTSIGAGAFRACQQLRTINYNGTIAQWNAITKGNGWDTFLGNVEVTYTVYCTDGEFTVTVPAVE